MQKAYRIAGDPAVVESLARLAEMAGLTVKEIQPPRDTWNDDERPFHHLPMKLVRPGASLGDWLDVTVADLTQMKAADFCRTDNKNVRGKTAVISLMIEHGLAFCDFNPADIDWTPIENTSLPETLQERLALTGYRWIELVAFFTTKQEFVLGRRRPPASVIEAIDAVLKSRGITWQDCRH